MDQRDGHAALTHSRGNALHRTMAYIANTEEAREIGFEQVRLALPIPALQICSVQPGPAKAVRIALQLFRQPVCVCCGTNQDEQSLRFSPLWRTSRRYRKDRLQFLFALGLNKLRERLDLHVRVLR